MKKNNKGFTLTELIIVIVIIGILAGVLIPSISGYVKKAKVSKGVQEAKQMDVVLSAEAIYQDREYFEAAEIEELLVQSDYSLVSGLKDYRFWYDASENRIKYLSMKEVFGEAAGAADAGFTQDCIEALSSAHPEYRYVDAYNDELRSTVLAVRNLVKDALAANSVSDSSTMSDETKLAVLGSMDSKIAQVSESLNNLKKNVFSTAVKTSIINYVKTFDTYNSVYVDNNLMYNHAYFATTLEELNSVAASHANISSFGDVYSVEAAHMVFNQGITKIPACTTSVGDANVTFDVTFTSIINVPDTVTTIQNNAFTNVSYCVGLIVKDTVVIDNQALSDAALTALSERKSNVSFVTLYLGTDFTVTYHSAEAKLNNGLTVSYVNPSNEAIELGDEQVVFAAEEGAIVSKYLIPDINFTSKKIDFSKIEKVMIRRSLIDNICTYTAILIDEDLKGYKVESFGFITDVDWNIEQAFISKNEQGERVVGATSAVLKVYLPTYVYNFTNFKGACIEVFVLPQYIKTTVVQGVLGPVEVYDGIALSSEPIKFYIEDGKYDASINKYVYEKSIEDLTKYSVTVGEDVYTCNQLALNRISIYTGSVVDNGDGTFDTSGLNYLFIRYYK